MIDLHGASVEGVLNQLPLKPSLITASSTPVSTALIETWIEQGAGQINALLARHNMDFLGADEEMLVKAGIEAYAAAMALLKFGADEAVRRPFWEIWIDCRRVVRETPQDLGHSMRSEDVIKTNIDLSDPPTKRWASKTFGGW